MSWLRKKKSRTLTSSLVVQQPDGDTVGLPVQDDGTETLLVGLPDQLLHSEAGSVGPETGGSFVTPGLNTCSRDMIRFHISMNKAKAKAIKLGRKPLSPLR